MNIKASMRTMSEREDYKKQIYQVLPVDIRRCLCDAFENFEKLQEIRLRVGKPLVVVYDNREYFLENDKMVLCPERAYCVSEKELRELMEYVSNYSRYAFEEELRQGYITINGGHRIGIAGKIIWENGRIKNMNNISFVNIRLAHEVKGCAKEIMEYVRSDGKVHNTLVISPPRCGKTTLLRDMIRLVSDGDKSHIGLTVGVVDERSEIGACYRGRPQNDLGLRADVLDGCPKAEGMMMMVRSMSPDVIAVDEIGSSRDVEAIRYVMNCGIHLMATVHGMNIDDIRNKPILGRMVKEKAFQRYIVLEAGAIGKVEAIFDERGTALFHAMQSHGCRYSGDEKIHTA